MPDTGGNGLWTLLTTPADEGTIRRRPAEDGGASADGTGSSSPESSSGASSSGTGSDTPSSTFLPSGFLSQRQRPAGGGGSPTAALPSVTSQSQPSSSPPPSSGSGAAPPTIRLPEGTETAPEPPPRNLLDQFTASLTPTPSGTADPSIQTAPPESGAGVAVPERTEVQTAAPARPPRKRRTPRRPCPNERRAVTGYGPGYARSIPCACDRYG